MPRQRLEPASVDQVAARGAVGGGDQFVGAAGVAAQLEERLGLLHGVGAELGGEAVLADRGEASAGNVTGLEDSYGPALTA